MIKSEGLGALEPTISGETSPSESAGSLAWPLRSVTILRDVDLLLIELLRISNTDTTYHGVVIVVLHTGFEWIIYPAIGLT